MLCIDIFLPIGKLKEQQEKKEKKTKGGKTNIIS